MRTLLQLRGVSRRESLEIILRGASKKYSEAEKEELCCRKNEIYRSYLDQMSEADISAETVSTLTALRKKGLKLAVGSSSKNARYILEKVGLSGYFDAISDGIGLTHSKPHPEVFLKAAQALGLKPRELLVVEDAAAGIEAANRGRFVSVGIGPAAAAETAQISIKTLDELLTVSKALSGIVIDRLSKSTLPASKR